MEVSGKSVAGLLREGLINFCPPCALLCFFRSPDSGDVYWHWLHLLDTGQVSALGLARGGSPVTCQRPLDWQTGRRLATQHFHPSSPQSQLVVLLTCSALFSSTVYQTPPTTVRPTDSNLQPPLPRILSSFLANNIWTPGVCSSSKPHSLALLLMDLRCSLLALPVASR